MEGEDLLRAPPTYRRHPQQFILESQSRAVREDGGIRGYDTLPKPRGVLRLCVIFLQWGWRAGAPPHADMTSRLGQEAASVILELPLDKITRPLMRTMANDPNKVQELIDIIWSTLEVEGVYYCFSGCHRYEAHQRLGLPTISCKICQWTKETLRHHLRSAINPTQIEIERLPGFIISLEVARLPNFCARCPKRYPTDYSYALIGAV
ncbi:hypothetical protein MLD38_036689 [Melastoma candidum]|uniref:Uncharacterized protein n=1 Tax=Melastoma candidum TaxID=119954 RepID=A0ACB9LKW0_9MYRT|nr:hypothetical protein MLD38_036689 [Melastoma candidum]